MFTIKPDSVAFSPQANYTDVVRGGLSAKLLPNFARTSFRVVSSA
jgi:hypothetical protein